MHLCQWKSDLYRNSDFWRWVFKVFKRSRKPTTEKSTTENPRRKRPIFVMENIFWRKVGIQSTDEMAFKRTETLREFPICRHQIWCAHAIVVQRMHAWTRKMPSCSFRYVNTHMFIQRWRNRRVRLIRPFEVMCLSFSSVIGKQWWSLHI